MCDQQRLRPACAYAQTDQSLCWSLEYYNSVKLLTEHRLQFLSLKGGCTGSSESTLVKMPHCWKSHVAAHMYIADIPKVHHTSLWRKHCRKYLITQGKVREMFGNIHVYVRLFKETKSATMNIFRNFLFSF